MTLAQFSILSALLVAPLRAAIQVDLKPQTIQAFDNYVKTAEARIDAQRDSPAFLWSDGTPVRKQRVRAGETVAEPWSGNGDIQIPDGLIHDWIGAVFIPRASLTRVIDLVQDYNNHKRIYQPEVIDSQLVARHADDFQIRYRLLKKKVITVVLNTDHEVHYLPIDATRWSSRSYSTRIAEVQSPGESGERELVPGHDHGFLWRLNSYWRFEERDGGVYVECEAISLSRDVPSGLGWLINPIIRSLPRDSLANTLRATREAVRKN